LAIDGGEVPNRYPWVQKMTSVSKRVLKMVAVGQYRWWWVEKMVGSSKQAKLS